MRQFISFFTVLVLLLSACTSGTSTDEPPDPAALLSDAIAQIRQAKNFRMIVEQVGVDFVFNISLEEGGPQLGMVMERGDALYVSPDTIYAKVKVSIGILAQEFEIFARDTKQWLRLIGTQWGDLTFAEGFNPSVLVAEDSGFQKALTALTDLKYIGEEDLDGTPVYHVQGGAGGAIVKDLLVGLVVIEKDVQIDVYVHRETKFPSIVIITVPDTATEREPENTAWRLEIYDVDAPYQLDDPEATPEP